MKPIIQVALDNFVANKGIVRNEDEVLPTPVGNSMVWEFRGSTLAEMNHYDSHSVLTIFYNTPTPAQKSFDQRRKALLQHYGSSTGEAVFVGGELLKIRIRV